MAKITVPAMTNLATVFLPSHNNQRYHQQVHRHVIALDIIRTEIIIAELDPPTPGADANSDRVLNALDITKVKRIIAASCASGTDTKKPFLT